MAFGFWLSAFGFWLFIRRAEGDGEFLGRRRPAGKIRPVVVRKVGLEPTRLAAHDPKSCSSANSDTPASRSKLYQKPRRVTSVSTCKIRQLISPGFILCRRMMSKKMSGQQQGTGHRWAVIEPVDADGRAGKAYPHVPQRGNLPRDVKGVSHAPRKRPQPSCPPAGTLSPIRQE